VSLGRDSEASIIHTDSLRVTKRDRIAEGLLFTNCGWSGNQSCSECIV